ncbi:MAG: sulfur oxidation c-type cytochrome SoxA [Hyphomicrobiaceae bacterium]|nr:sulfur oxidation c-type cytochrome SoxA [Hyphomicrobiaceae bacterium]
MATQKTTRRVVGVAAIAGGATLALGLSIGTLTADPNNNELVIDGKKIVTKIKAPKGSPFEHLYSGWRYRNKETQTVQADDFENPGFPMVELGRELWSKADGKAGKSCQSCHNDAKASMKGVRAQMPKWNAAKKRPLTLEQTVNLCRTERMGAKKWKWESNEMLGMTAFVGLQSRGMPVNVKTDGDMQPWWAKGKKLYYTRTGQLDLSCASCHEANSGRMIRADHLSQGHINGFPLYRFKWQKMGSIHRRLKGCVKDTRATPYNVGSDEMVALELYVASRGQGLSVETPAVRN